MNSVHLGDSGKYRVEPGPKTEPELSQVHSAPKLAQLAQSATHPAPRPRPGRPCRARTVRPAARLRAPRPRAAAACAPRAPAPQRLRPCAPAARPASSSMGSSPFQGLYHKYFFFFFVFHYKMIFFFFSFISSSMKNH